ncbi:MAG: class I SAM-dependent methyltransferase [Candidatus Moraniibacteriota bacterium]|nr:MAG: class I SAM-dependent methyltransferase [Candidatus Moranbacteria bacterium]
MDKDIVIEWCDKEHFETKAKQLIKPASVILDIGCGIRPQRFVVPDVAICVEPYQEYVDYLKRSVDSANILVIPLGALEALKALPDRSVDSIFMIDVIEHMPKSLGARVIDECKRVARGQIIVFTPLGFMPQAVHAGEADGWGLGGGEFQDHKSGWYPEDFSGWNIIGCKNLHVVDHKGVAINPPYGGFYAIINLPKRSDLFNRIYAEEAIKKSMFGTSAGELFDEFSQSFVDREIALANNRCAVKACLIAAEQLSLGVAPGEVDRVFERIKAKKYELFNEEQSDFTRKVLAFGKALQSFCEREAELSSREAELSSREAELSSREAELSSRIAAFNSSKSVKVLKAVGFLR